MEFADATSFHAAFLYESVWDALVCLVLLWAACRFADRLRAGDVFLLYVCLNSVGRFLVETLRVDDVFVIGDAVRGNLVVSGALAVAFALILLLRHSRKGTPRPKTADLTQPRTPSRPQPRAPRP